MSANSTMAARVIVAALVVGLNLGLASLLAACGADAIRPLEESTTGEVLPSPTSCVESTLEAQRVPTGSDQAVERPDPASSAYPKRATPVQPPPSEAELREIWTGRHRRRPGNGHCGGR